ncbi:rab effector MyRIP-like [Stegastes partitus]|uniref:Rab effector MyRIP-like n=3 Tax=Stegastes partitus TaxID=144197 RepID=A0A9Y4K8N7_9TELE|nr:PREDICTED: rab effector MyRIP-like [Stegastes partitus]
MGRKLDLSGLTDSEAEHVLQVVQRDMKLRKKEEERLSELKQELDEEGSRCLLLSRQSCFNQRCCIRCCSPFTFLLNPKRQCRDCHYNVCKACRVYNKQDKAWLCSACQKSRLLKTQSLEWFYTNVKKRFKRFGSAKVLKTLYRKHLAEHSALSELTEGSAYEESICNEGSVCGSDSAFYRQTEGKDRSHSAFSLLDNDPPGLIQDSSQALKKDGGGSTMTTWKSVDRLDNAGVSSVLKSVDGNWIALQSAQLSRPSLLTKRKSQVYSALERESGVVSAYEGLGSDNETKPEPDSSWGAVLQEIHRKMTDSNFNPHDTGDRIPSSLTGRRGSRNDVLSDSEGNWKPNKPLLALLKRKVPAEIRRPSSSRRTSIIDVNFNVEVAGGAEEEEEEEEEEEMKVAAEPEVGKVRRKKRRSRKEPAAASCVSDLNRNDNRTIHPEDAGTPDTLTSGSMTPEPSDRDSDLAINQVDEELMLNLQQPAGRFSDSSAREEELDEDRDAGSDGEMEQSMDRQEEDESLWKMETDLDRGRTEDEEENETDDEEVKYRLYRLVAQSRLTYFSSTDDELDRAGQSEGEWDKDEDMEEEDEKAERLTYKLCQLEREVRATQFSSTEDELDRIGVEEGEHAEDGEEELAVKVCRLANQVNATQFSSTEDELDRAGRGEDGAEEIDEETLWKLQAKKTVQAAQLRDLASLVSASQFSSTEDELDRVGEDEGEIEQEVEDGGTESRAEGGVERRESFGDIDVNMFDLWDEIEERKKEGSEEEVTNENVLSSETKAEDVEHDECEVVESKHGTEVNVAEDDKIARGHLCDEKVLKGDEAGKEKVEREELKTGVEVERMNKMKVLHEANVQQENQPEAARADDEEGEEKSQKKSKESVGEKETAADSDEEDAEFSRIISSMLMMTLEDMQVETTKDQAGENRGRHRELQDEIHRMGRESGFREKTTDAQSTDASEETEGVSKELQSFNKKSESVVQKRPGENVSEETGGDISGKLESDIPGRNENVQVERQTSLVKEKPAVATIEDTFETNEATCERTEADDEDQQDGRRTTVTETQGDTRDCEEKDLDGGVEETKDDMELSSTSSPQTGLLTPEEIQSRYSAVSLRSITTEVLKVLNATEELLQGVEGGDNGRLSASSLPPNTDPKKLDQQFSRLEENVYVAAGSVFSLEAELSDLEECARGICSSTSDMELSFLEEQVAAAAAKVQQSELQISDISARIAALRSAGLNVDAQSRFTKTKTLPVMPVTLDSSRQLRRRLPAPPVKEDKET